ncbi:MAG: hypothetical protein U0X40_11675 [Ferruginibacter sp.]
MGILKNIGLAGFLFFLIKGLLWILLAVLVYYGVLSKQQLKRWKAKLFFWKKGRTVRS